MAEITGAVKLLNLPDVMCAGSVQEMLSLLAQNLAIELSDNLTNVTVSVAEPPEGSRDDIWFRRGAGGSFVGIYVFSGGAWVQMFPAPNGIFKHYGNSNTPPAGYELITTSTPGFTAADVARLQGGWQKDPTNTFWTIYETIYTGL